MIKYWQSMQDYKYFLTESKAHFDSSERNRLHTELWNASQKLRLFDTDKAMEFLMPFYSSTARPSLTLWVDRLNNDRLLASLIGCTQATSWTGSGPHR